jgi:alkylhydroperoxidase family enzyme
MTWLPVEIGTLAERDAVLGLKREVYEPYREALRLAWTATDPRLLDLCRLRLAQLVDARAELADADAQLLADLERWETCEAFSERERAALAFAEQFHLDHNGIATEHEEALAAHLSRSEYFTFVRALHLNDAYQKVLSLLDVAPDPPSLPPRIERLAPSEPVERASDPEPVDPALTGRALVQALVAPELQEAVLAYGRAAMQQSLIDDVTSEVVRLRNANHQACLF